MPYELEDQKFFPAMLRQQQLEAISSMVILLKTYRPLVQWFNKHNISSGEWTDCCTGSAGPVLYLLHQNIKPSRLYLTDKFLHLDQHAIPHHNVVLQESDILTGIIPGDGVVTMFNAFHHFNYFQQQAFLHKISAENRPLLIAEITRPGILNFISVTLAATVLQVLIAPFIKPFRLSRLIFTYLLPVNIFTVLWDGWMSVIFGMKKKQFTLLCQSCSTSNYSFTYKKYGPFWQRVYCLQGKPIITKHD